MIGVGIYIGKPINSTIIESEKMIIVDEEGFFLTDEDENLITI